MKAEPLVTSPPLEAQLAETRARRETIRPRLSVACFAEREKAAAEHRAALSVARAEVDREAKRLIEHHAEQLERERLDAARALADAEEQLERNLAGAALEVLRPLAKQFPAAPREAAAAISLAVVGLVARAREELGRDPHALSLAIAFCEANDIDDELLFDPEAGVRIFALSGSLFDLSRQGTRPLELWRKLLDMEVELERVREHGPMLRHRHARPNPGTNEVTRDQALARGAIFRTIGSTKAEERLRLLDAAWKAPALPLPQGWAAQGDSLTARHY